MKQTKLSLIAVVILTFSVLMLGILSVMAHPSGTSTLGDFVWFDANADGVKDTTVEWDDTGIDGVLVNLYIDNGTTPGVLDSGDTLQKQMVTGDNPGTSEVEHGWYDFIELGQNISWWVEIPASNFEHGGPLEGYEYTGNYTDTTPYSGDNPRFYHSPSSMYDQNDVDFGFALKEKVSIGNVVWFDENKNSAYDPPTELGIGGITMLLLRDENGNGRCEPDGPDGRILMTTTTVVTVTEAPIITATVGISNTAFVDASSSYTVPTNITFTADIITPTIGFYQFQDMVPSDAVTNTDTYSTSYYCVAIPSSDLLHQGYTDSSLGGDHAPDINDSIDDGTVYNGANPSSEVMVESDSSYVVSQPLRASVGGQDPSIYATDTGDPEGYADSSAYMTVDFGFIKTPDAVHLTAVKASAGMPWGLGVGFMGLLGLVGFAWRRRR